MQWARSEEYYAGVVDDVTLDALYVQHLPDIDDPYHILVDVPPYLQDLFVRRFLPFVAKAMPALCLMLIVHGAVHEERMAKQAPQPSRTCPWRWAYIVRLARHWMLAVACCRMSACKGIAP
eukprot:scaffold377_cov563-Prasinococcus_capsulatus_cf.AAC.6